jgi:putative colanic acid biosynthesis glycosyltransferase
VLAEDLSVSVVTVCFNDFGGLQETYASVRKQARPPKQWIVVDGGSSDGAEAWLRTIDWDRLTWSSEPDRGIYDAMNKGLARATAEYVLFLNSGDVLSSPDVLQAVGKALASCSAPPSLLYGDCFEVYAGGRAFLRRARPPFWVPIGMPTTHQAMYFRVDALGHGFDPDYRLSGDYEAVCRLYLRQRGRDFLRLARPLAHFQLGGRSDQQRSLLLQENLDIRRRVLGMGAAGARVLHVLHGIHGLVKRYVPFLHRLARYG